MMGWGRRQRFDPLDSDTFYFRLPPHFVVVPASLLYFYCKTLCNVAIFFSIPHGSHNLGDPLPALSSSAYGTPPPILPGPCHPPPPRPCPLHLYSNLVDCDWRIKKSKFQLRVTLADHISYLTILARYYCSSLLCCLLRRTWACCLSNINETSLSRPLHKI